MPENKTSAQTDDLKNTQLENIKLTEELRNLKGIGKLSTFQKIGSILVAVIAGAILYFAGFFYANHKLSEAKDIKLGIQLDSLNSQIQVDSQIQKNLHNDSVIRIAELVELHQDSLTRTAQLHMLDEKIHFEKKQRSVYANSNNVAIEKLSEAKKSVEKLRSDSAILTREIDRLNGLGHDKIENYVSKLRQKDKDFEQSWYMVIGFMDYNVSYKKNINNPDTLQKLNLLEELIRNRTAQYIPEPKRRL